METFDGYFNIEEKSDGFYLEVFAPGTDGKPVKLEAIEEQLRAKKIEKYDIGAIKSAINIKDDNNYIKIADKYIDSSYAGDKQYKIEVAEDRMSAYLTFHPSAGDQQYVVDPQDIENDLRARNVTYGIDVDLLNEVAITREFNKPYIIAKGDVPTEPIPGYVEYKFKTTKDYKPEVDDQGNVNFHKLSVISNITDGDLLAVLTQTVPGESGKNLSGIEISAKKSKPIRIKYGKNTKPNDDKTELYATKSGLVKIVDDKIIVNNVYEVPNNVGNSTGDIDFDGSVVVQGNVITGFSVIAKGDIEVMGVVEGATVIAGGNIVLHSGIQGMGKSQIETGGDLQTKFIEQADVICGGDIHSEAILHSNVSCRGEVSVDGKKGLISGGKIRAGTSVTCRTLGSHMGTATEIEVGIDPAMMEEYNELRKNLPKLTEEAEKLEKVIVLLNKRKEMIGNLDHEKSEMYKSAVRNKVFLTNKVATSQKRVNELQEEVENRNAGIVKVSGIMYTGVRIGIGSIYYYVKEELKYVSLYKDGAEIKLSSL
jgi:hypothetical protein